VEVFRPYIGQLSSELILENPSWLNGDNNYAMLAGLASKALMVAFSTQYIRSGFMKIGIVPFNPHALNLDFEPNSSLIFEEDGTLLQVSKKMEKSQTWVEVI
jgi:hypothetical protein